MLDLSGTPVLLPRPQSRSDASRSDAREHRPWVTYFSAKMSGQLVLDLGMIRVVSPNPTASIATINRGLYKKRNENTI
jgi:hypothetical protein